MEKHTLLTDLEEPSDEQLSGLMQEVAEEAKTLAVIQQDELCKKAVFKVKHFFIVENKLGGEKHVYETFMKESLKIKSINDIYDSSKL